MTDHDNTGGSYCSHCLLDAAAKVLSKVGKVGSNSTDSIRDFNSPSPLAMYLYITGDQHPIQDS